MTTSVSDDIILYSILGVMLGSVVVAIKNAIVAGLPSFIAWFTPIPSKANWWFYAIILSGVLYLFLRVLYKINVSIYIDNVRDKEKRQEARKEEDEMSELVRKPLIFYGSDSGSLKELIKKLDEKISICRENYYIPWESGLEEKRNFAEAKLKRVLESERIDKIRQEKYRLLEDIEQLEQVKQDKIREAEIEEDNILRNLDANSKKVIKKCNLNEKERNALISDGFEQVNEFCVYEKKRIPVFVKQESNHSVSHTFLVWSVNRLIDKIHGIGYIEDHLSKDADITFDYKGKTYALEIETGSLLGKSEQTRDKVNYLNRKYEDSWMFIVSNRDLYGKYKKLGFTSQRKDVLKNIKKLLKIA